MTDGFVQVTGPTTMRVNNVLSLGNYYWADLEWDPTSNTFQVIKVGPMNYASMEGLWTLHYDWGCVGSFSIVTIQFFSDGTFLTGDKNPVRNRAFFQPPSGSIPRYARYRELFGGFRDYIDKGRWIELNRFERDIVVSHGRQVIRRIRAGHNRLRGRR